MSCVKHNVRLKWQTKWIISCIPENKIGWIDFLSTFGVLDDTSISNDSTFFELGFGIWHILDFRNKVKRSFRGGKKTYTPKKKVIKSEQKKKQTGHLTSGNILKISEVIGRMPLVSTSYLSLDPAGVFLLVVNKKDGALQQRDRDILLKKIKNIIKLLQLKVNWWFHNLYTEHQIWKNEALSTLFPKIVFVPLFLFLTDHLGISG